MALTDNEYRSTGSILKVLSLGMIVSGLYSHSVAVIAVGFGYWMASANPLRYRVVINIGLILHGLQLVRALYCLATADVFASYTDLLVSPVALAVLARYYPSAYPLSSNILNCILPAGFNVSVIDAFPVILKKLSGNGIIGTVEGLYYDSDAFSIVQEEGFLGFTPARNIIETAQRAEVQGGKTLLDVGSGIGGPACLLAAEFGLDVTGVDLLDWNVVEATKLAAQRGLSDTCRFEQANALSLPFEDKSFDYVFGMDAWCHVPGRDKLLNECHRVLKDDGTLLFHDWLTDKSDSEGFRFVYAFPPLETLESYQDKLRDAGFDILCAENRSVDFKAHVAGLRESVHRNKRQLIDVCGRELYDNWDLVVEYTYRMIDEQRLGSGRFIARKK